MDSWYDITRSPDFQELTPENKAAVKQRFYQEKVAPFVQEQDGFDSIGHDKMFDWFMQQPDDSGQGAVTSMLGSAVRGAGEFIPGAIQGFGALTGIGAAEKAGEAVRESIQGVAPVNPLYEQGIPAKLANTAGQIGSLLIPSAAGGAIGRSIAASRLPLAATQAQRVAALARGVDLGAEVASLGSAGLQGAAQGSQIAKQYGMEGLDRYANILANVGAELIPEKIPFGLKTETAFAKKLFGGTPQVGGFANDVLTNTVEEGLTKTGQNLATQTFAPVGVETPDISEGVLEDSAYGGFGGTILGGVNLATGAYKSPATVAAQDLTTVAENTSNHAKLTVQAAKNTADLSDEVDKGTAFNDILAAMQRGQPVSPEEPSDVESRLTELQNAPSPFYQQLQRGITPQSAFVGQETPSDVESRLAAIQNEPIATATAGTPISAIGTEEVANPEAGDGSGINLGNDGRTVPTEAQFNEAESPSPETLVSPTTVEPTDEESLSAETPKDESFDQLQERYMEIFNNPLPKDHPNRPQQDREFAALKSKVKAASIAASSGISKGARLKNSTNGNVVTVDSVDPDTGIVEFSGASNGTTYLTSGEYAVTNDPVTVKKKQRPIAERDVEELDNDSVFSAIYSDKRPATKLSVGDNVWNTHKGVGKVTKKLKNKADVTFDSGETQRVDEANVIPANVAKWLRSKAQPLSPTTEKTQKSSQTIIGSNAQTGAEMPVQRQAGEATITPTTETPTNATEGQTKPMSGGSGSVVRDKTKEEQQTPGEFIPVGNPVNQGILKSKKEASARLTELEETVSKNKQMLAILAEFNLAPNDAYEVAKDKHGRWSLGATHKHKIALAARDKSPVSAAAVDAYKIKLPEGYVKDGELYVYRPETKTDKAPTETPSEFLSTRLNAAKSREEAREILNGVKNLLALKDLAKEMGYPTTGTKKDVVNRLVAAMGSRFDAAAIRDTGKQAEKPVSEMSRDEFNRGMAEKVKEATAKEGVIPKAEENEQEKAKREWQQIVAERYAPTWGTTAASQLAVNKELIDTEQSRVPREVIDLIASNKNVPIEMADKAGIKGIDGYVRDGEVYRPESKPAKAPEKQAPSEKVGKVVTDEQIDAKVEELLRAPTKATKKPAVVFGTQTEETAFKRGFSAAVEKQGEMPPPEKIGLSPKDRKWDDAWRKGWASGQTFVRSLPELENKESEPAPETAVNQKPEQPASQNLIDMAKQFGGRIAWADGDMGIIEAFQRFGSKSLYVAIVGDRYSTSDFISLTPSNRKELLGENEELFLRKREELIKDNEQKLADYPNGPFTNGQTLVASKEVPEKVVSVFKEWAKMLGLNAPTRIVLTTFDGGVKMASSYGGKFRRIGAVSLLGKGDGGQFMPLGKDDFHISYKDDISFARILETIAHELGHALQRQAFDKLPQGQRQDIMLEHEAWLKKVGSQKAIDGIKAMRSMRVGKVYPGTDIERFDELTAYWKSFSEWFADQVARWSTTTAKPLSVVEKFFARLGKKLREFFFSSKHRFAPNEKVADWLNSLSPDFQTGEIGLPSEEVVAVDDGASKRQEAGYGAKLNSARKLINKSGPKNAKAQNEALAVLMTMPVKDLQDAFNVLTGDATKLANRRQLANNILNEILTENQSGKTLSAEDIFGQSERELEKERAEQEKLTESRREDLTSIIGTPQGVEMNAVSSADGQESLALVHNSGDVPGVLNAFVGTSKEFLSNSQNEKDFPELFAILKNGRVDEGNFAYGRAFVFTDGIGVNASDRANAAKLGISPAIAAVRRVLIHEGLVHRGIYGLPARLQMQILQWVKQNAKPEDLDALAKTYPQYADWATNPQQMLGLAEEFLAKNVEKMTRFPTSGPLARLVEILKDIWRYVTGKDGEPTVQNIRDIVKLLRAGAKAADARLVNGSGIKMSYVGEGAINNLPEERRQFMRDSLDTAKAMAANGKTSEEIRAVTGWFPGKYDGKMRWEIPDEGADLHKESTVEVQPPQIVRGNVVGGRLVPSAEGKLFVPVANGEESIHDAADTPQEAERNWFAAFAPNKTRKVGGTNNGKLSEVLDHPALFEAYPNLKEVEVVFRPLSDRGGDWNQEQKLIRIASGMSKERTISVLLHEAQHAIQFLEGFDPGSSPSQFSDYTESAKSRIAYYNNELDALADALVLQGYMEKGASLGEAKELYRREFGKDPNSLSGQHAKHLTRQELLDETERMAERANKATALLRRGTERDQYMKTTGEIEARDVQARQKLTPEQRKAIAPYSSENIAKEDAIVMFGGIKMSQLGKLTPTAAELKDQIRVAIDSDNESAAKALVPTDITVIRLLETQDVDEDGNPTEYFILSNGSPDSVMSRLSGEDSSFRITESSDNYTDRDIRSWLFDGLFEGMVPKKDFSDIKIHRIDVESRGGDFVLPNEIKASRISYANPLDAQLASASERMRQMREKQGEQEVDAQQIRNEIRKAYDAAIQGQGSVQAPLQQVYDLTKAAIPALTEKQFGEQVQALYEDGSAFLVPTDRSADMLAAGEKWGVYDVAGLPASYIGVMPSQETTKVYGTGSIFQGGRGRIYGPVGSQTSGEGAASIPAGDNSERAQTLRRVVDEELWANSTPMQRKEALDTFAKSVWGNRMSNPRNPLAAFYTTISIPEENGFAELSDKSSRNRPVIDVNLSVKPSHPILDESALEAHAFVYDMMQEEFIHTAQLFQTWNEWVSSGSQKSIKSFTQDKYIGMLNEIVKQRSDPKAKAKIDAALLNSWNLYNPRNAKTSVEGVFAELQKDTRAIPTYMMELGRQLVQIGRQDFTTETGWTRFKETLIKWANKICDALRSVLADVKGGIFGKLLKNEIDAIEGVISHLESGGGVMPTEIKASRVPDQDIGDMRSDVASVFGKGDKAEYKGRPIAGKQPEAHIKHGVKASIQLAKTIVQRVLDSGVDVADLINELTASKLINGIGITHNPAMQYAILVVGLARMSEAAAKANAAGDTKLANELAIKVDEMGARLTNNPTNIGRGLGIMGHIADDPEFAPLFLINGINSTIAKEQEKKLHIGVQNPDGVIDGLLEKDKKIGDTLENESTDAAEELTYESLIKEGENSLNDVEKSLWQRAKELMAHLGAIAKAELSKSFSGMASNALSPSDLVKRYIAMPSDKREAKKAQFKKQLRVVLSKLLGDNDSPKGKKKSDMVDAFEKRASKESIKDKVFSQDEQKAIKTVIKLLTSARPGQKTPLAAKIPWKKLFEMARSGQGTIKDRMFDAIKSEPAFESLATTEQKQLADILEKSWEARREQMFATEIDRIKRQNRMSKQAKEVFDERAKILRMIDAGTFDHTELAKLVAEKYGIRSLTDAEKKRIKDIAAELSAELPPYKRQKLEMELENIMVAVGDISFAEVAKAWWMHSVLQGWRTAFTIGMSFLSGAYETLGNIATTVITHPLDANAYHAAGKSIEAWFKEMPKAFRSAVMYVLSGDSTLQDPSMLNNSALFDKNFKGTSTVYPVAKKLFDSKNPILHAMGWMMTYGNRLLIALDKFGGDMTKMAALPIMYYHLAPNYDRGQLGQISNIERYKKQVINDEFGGNAPTTQEGKSQVYSWAKHSMFQKLNEIANLEENMNQVAGQGNMTINPTGLGGLVYDSVKYVDAMFKRRSEKYLQEAREGMLVDGAPLNNALRAPKLALAHVFNVAMHNAITALGMAFARFAGNKLNQALSFIPGVGALRLAETVKGQKAHDLMVMRNQTIGMVGAAFLYSLLKQIEDEPDDEKRGWGWEGAWANITETQRQQLMAAGKQQHTFEWRGKDGKWKRISYANWPISSLLAAFASLSDMIKYSPDKWSEKGNVSKSLSAAWAAGTSVGDVAAMSQLAEIMGTSVHSRDPVEASMNRIGRVASNWAGGFIPRIPKDIDQLMQPEINTYKGMWEMAAKQVPFYRRYEGKTLLDVFGKQVKVSRTPWSREIIMQPSEPEYEMIGALNNHGVWLTAGNPENRLVGKGNHRRSMTQDEADRYVTMVGKGYRDLVLKYGHRMLAMPKERAKAFAADKADEIRDRSAKQAVRKPIAQ